MNSASGLTTSTKVAANGGRADRKWASRAGAPISFNFNRWQGD
jgi:hypothetical protein